MTWDNGVTEEQIKEFKIEFKALLEKYNATIFFCVSNDSDTHGLSDECLRVNHNTPNSFETVDILKVDGWYLDKNNI